MSRRQRSEPENDPANIDAEAELDAGNLEAGECNFELDAQAWTGFTKIFQQVQDILDQNRLLIGTINQNHQSGVSERISSNIGLINNLNRNLSKIHKLYASATVSFTKSFREAPNPGVVSEEAEKAGLLLKAGAEEAECSGATDALLPEKPERLVPSASAEG